MGEIAIVLFICSLLVLCLALALWQLSNSYAETQGSHSNGCIHTELAASLCGILALILLILAAYAGLLWFVGA